MKKNIIILSLLLLLIIILLADRKALQTEIIGLSHTIDSLRKSNADMKSMIAEQNQRIEKLGQVLQKQKNEVKNGDTAYWIIFVLAIAVLNIIFFMILKNRLPSTEDNPVRQIREKSLSASEQEKPATFHEKTGTDHTLALKFGLEIHRMRKRTENMPENTKGIRALKNSLKRMEESFNDRGYEMADLMGKAFADGLTMDARFVPSDEFGPGKHIITKVITPQINFNGVLIQAAQVEVGVGE